jgi:hypothetical protein
MNLLAAIPGWAATIPGLYNTGVDNTGAVLSDGASDAHYTLAAGSASSGPTFVATSASGWPIAPLGPWLDDCSTSAWITPPGLVGPHAPAEVANYRYETSFDLTGLDPATAVIMGHWATDNAGLDILINGVSTGQGNSQQFTNMTYFLINHDFVSGRNTLTFLVNNGPGDSGESPTGLRVEMAGTADPINTAPIRLSINRLDEGHVHLSWPVTTQALGLRQAETLAPPLGWTPVAVPAVQTGDQMTVTLGTHEGNEFFRLQPILRRRAIFPKPANTVVDSNKADPGLIVLKFHEGTHVRLRSGELKCDPRSLTADEKALLTRVDLTPEQVSADLETLNYLNQQTTNRFIARMFLESEEVLAGNKAQGEAMSGDELADLDLYYYLSPNPDPTIVGSFIDWLNGLRSVEIAYAHPRAVPACTTTPPAKTVDVMSSQGYLMAAPVGINAQYAWTYPGGAGLGVKLIDVEKAWRLNHEDLPGNQFFQVGIFSWLPDDIEHGTAVLGELVACADRFGATGIVPSLTYGVSALRVPDAVNNAAAALTRGDVILIAQHAPGPSSGVACDSQCYTNCGNSSCTYEYVPMEYWQADFDAIKAATARGIIVVEAAGDGSMDLAGQQYQGRFGLGNNTDSGAIMVGAGKSATREPWCFSNFGNRVNLQGWGDSVGTLGYGLDGNGNIDPSLRANGDPDPSQWYTRNFGGTSSAAPIVAGAVCAVQGVLRAQGMPVLLPSDMRGLLTATGTPQPHSTLGRPIGPLPDLRNALNSFSFLQQNAEFVSHTVPSCMIEGRTYFVSITMRNNGRNMWNVSNDDYFLVPEDPLWGFNRINLPHDVQPTDVVTFSFPVTAPARGHYDFTWRMTSNGGGFGDVTPTVPVDVDPDNNAEFVSQGVPTTMVAGETHPVNITMKNTGAAPWAVNSSYKLKPETQSNGIWTGGSLVVTQLVSPEPAPNDEYIFKFNVTAPNQAGTYNFQWRMVDEKSSACVGQEFGDFTPNVSITVVSPTANYACFGPQTLPQNIHYGQQSTVTVTMTNCGTTTWTSAAGYRLGSQGPQDNMYWGTNRIDLPPNTSVGHGDSVTFRFVVTAPTYLDNRSYYVPFTWQMLQEGVGFFGQTPVPTLVQVVP